jgi:putative transcriptional regulator
MDVRWRLRMAAAQREVWTGAQLRRLLAERAGLELSSASVSALLTKQPAEPPWDWWRPGRLAQATSSTSRLAW